MSGKVLLIYFHPSLSMYFAEIGRNLRSNDDLRIPVLDDYAKPLFQIFGSPSEHFELRSSKGSINGFSC